MCDHELKDVSHMPAQLDYFHYMQLENALPAEAHQATSISSNRSFT